MSRRDTQKAAAMRNSDSVAPKNQGEGGPRPCAAARISSDIVFAKTTAHAHPTRQAINSGTDASGDAADLCTAAT